MNDGMKNNFLFRVKVDSFNVIFKIFALKTLRPILEAVDNVYK